MSASDIQRRVDAWTDTRSTFPRDDETPSALWDACSGSFGATSAPALGCLLALVREAWGPDVNIMERAGTQPGFGVIVIWRGAEVLFVHDNDGRPERLVAALEAAP